MIEHLRSRFPDAGGVVAFAGSILRSQRTAALRNGQPWEPFEFGDPAAALDVGLKAFVNAANLGGALQYQGRWIVRCPSCAGAEYIDFEQPVFLCCSCWNAAHGHEWLKVEVPAAGRRAEIEGLLSKRPGKNRHWQANESVAQLRRENRQHGIGV